MYIVIGTYLGTKNKIEMIKKLITFKFSNWYNYITQYFNRYDDF